MLHHGCFRKLVTAGGRMKDDEENWRWGWADLRSRHLHSFVLVLAALYHPIYTEDRRALFTPESPAFSKSR